MTDKKTIYITEAQKKMLLEDKATDYLKKLIRTYSSDMLKPYLETKVSELPDKFKEHFQEADNRLYKSCVEKGANLLMFLRLQFLKHFDISRGKGPLEFIYGIGRIGIAELGFFNEYANQSDISLLKQLVLFIHFNKELFGIEINSDLNGWNFQQLKEVANAKRKEFNLQNRKNLSNFSYQGQHHYTVVPINSQEEARKYAPYTTWCVTDNAYSSYAQGGARFYFCLRDGFENVKREVGEGCPLDEYGLSMVSVLVDMDGEPTIVTTRWNHDYDGENNENLRTAEQVQNVLGINFYETFKPYTREELHSMGIVLFDEVQELLDSGKKPYEIFDWVGDFLHGFSKVELNGKFNFINTEGKFNYVNTKGKLISDTWFDDAWNFENGFAKVKLKGKWNFINTEGKPISDKWFDSVWDFKNGFAKVKLNEKWNFIDAEGLIGDTWFDMVYNFCEKFARVELNRKCNFIDTKGEYVSNTWFDEICDFDNGLAGVQLNDKCNFINTEGKLISDTWFDEIWDFNNWGLAGVQLNNKYNFINTEGMLISDTWFDVASDFHYGCAGVKLNNKYNFINAEGMLISDTWFDVAYEFSCAAARVRLYDKWNFINTEGKLISDIWFDWADDFRDTFTNVRRNRKWYRLDREGNLYDSETRELVKKASLRENRKTIYITEAQLSEIKKKHKKKKAKKDCSAMAQVHNKVNSGIMAGITCGGMMEEGKLNEGPNSAANPFGEGKYWSDDNAVAFLCVKGSNKIFVAKVMGKAHADMFSELYMSGKIADDILDDGCDDIQDLYNLTRSGRYWTDVNLISLWKTPLDKAGADDLYDCVDELRSNGINVDTKSLIVEYWDNPSANSMFLPYSWFFNGTLEMLLSTGLKNSQPLNADKNVFAVRLNNGVFHLDRAGSVVEPATTLREGISSENYNFKKDIKSILDFMREEGLNVYPYPGVKLNWDDQDGLFIRTGYYEPETKTVVLFCKDRHPKDILRSAAHEFIHHTQNLDGKDLNFTSDDDVKDNKRLEKIEAEAYLKGNIYFRKWTEHKNKNGKEMLQESVNENLIDELAPEEVDLSSFNIKKNLNPKFWKDGKLDSRIRLKLLDISDDFIDFLEVDWAKPKDVIITGSLANFNWNKQFSDIDLHVLYDFSDIDEKTEFVKEYFDAKKKLWNEEHQDLTVFGFPIEVYVQDINEEHTSSGVYSLDKNDWITEPKREPLATAKVDKEYIRKKVAHYATLIDNIADEFESNPDDEYTARTTNEKAEALFKKIKGERTDAFDQGKGEISNGNVIFKALRRLGYIEKIIDIRQRSYDALNSIN